MADKKEYALYKKHHLDKIGKTLLNNKELSDITFVVKEQQYHASRIMMSASSEVFAALLKEHFANLTDREVPLHGIQHNESFFYILTYIHGVEINLTLMKRDVMCDLLALTEKYKLAEFHADLKCYLSKIRRFKIKSIVVMLNTAKIHGLTDLYNRLKIYVHKRAEHFVKHKSFVNLKYDVLLDIIKSDWLYAKEVNIFRAALLWHSENIMDVESVNESDDEMQNTSDSETQSEVNLYDDDDDDDDSDDNFNNEEEKHKNSPLEIYLIENFLCKFSAEMFEHGASDQKRVEPHGNVSLFPQILPEYSDNHDVTYCDRTNKNQEESSLETTNNANENSNITSEKFELNEKGSTEESQKSETGLLQTFSEKILKVLFSHIRFQRLYGFDLFNAMETEPFTKYKEHIMNLRYNDNLDKSRPRNMYTGFTRKFTIHKIRDIIRSKKELQSKETYSILNLEWVIRAVAEVPPKDPESSNVMLCVHISPGKQVPYNPIKITVISHNPCVNDLVCNNIFCRDKINSNSVFGFDRIMFSKLINRDKGFIKNNTLTVVMHVEPCAQKEQ